MHRSLRIFASGISVLASLAIGCTPDSADDSGPKASSYLAAPLAQTPSLMRRVARDKRVARSLPITLPQVVLKLREGTDVRLRDALLQTDGHDGESDAVRARKDGLLQRAGLTRTTVEGQLGTLNTILRSPPQLTVDRLFGRAEHDLDAERSEGEQLGGMELADLNLYYQVRTGALPPSAVSQLLERLNALDIVEIAYPAPLPIEAAADIPPTTSLFSNLQTYINPAPSGIDSTYAWTKLGGRGAGIKVIDIEGNWYLDHEDLPSTFFQAGDIGRNVHGTAVLCEIAAVRNGYGMTGLVSDATIGISAVMNKAAGSTGPSEYNVARAISVATPQLRAGDVILVEAQAKGPDSTKTCTCNCTQFEYIALEYWSAEYDAMRAATARGITVVEATGNGGMDFDDPIYEGAFDRTLFDSGAIMVGGGTFDDHVAECWASYGTRVDVQGWGDSVATCSYGDLAAVGGPGDVRQWYTSTFAGTSSASPMVVGAVASLQGIRRARLQPPLTPSAMRTLLNSTGTAQGPGPLIGPLPNLRAAIGRL